MIGVCVTYRSEREFLHIEATDKSFLRCLWNSLKELSENAHLPQASHIPQSNPQAVISVITNGPFYQHCLTLIPAWISNHMPS